MSERAHAIKNLKADPTVGRKPPERLRLVEDATVLSPDQDPQLLFKVILKDIEKIIREQPLELMWIGVSRYLLQLRQELTSYHPEIQAFVQAHLDEVLEILRDQSHWEEQINTADDSQRNQIRSVAAQEALHSTAHEFLTSRHEKERIVVHEIGWDRILSDQEHFGMFEKTVEGEHVRVLTVRAEEGQPWYDFIIPPNEQLMHKGGASRVLLKILAGAPLDLILAELPINDIDAIGCGDKTDVQRLGLLMGADIEGIETVDDFDDLPELLRDRDLDMNQAFMTHNGLVFSEDAFRSARSGKIALSGGDRAIYGSEVMYYDGVCLAKNRGMYRLMKMVIEGKAREFDYTPLNEKVDLGIYWLILARKFAKKKNAGELLRRFFDTGKSMGQIQEGETNIYDVLDRVHTDHPFFRFDDAKMDETGHVRWLAKKLFRVAEKAFRIERGFASGLSLERNDFDTIPRTISLATDHPSPRIDAAITEAWIHFVERCRQRADEFQRRDEFSSTSPSTT